MTHDGAATGVPTASALIEPGRIQLRRIRGREELSCLYEYELELEVDEDGGLPPELVTDLLRSPCALRFGETGAEIHGTLCSITMRSTAQAQPIYYDAKLVPTLWVLSRIRRSRIFQNLDAPGIVRSVLTEIGFVEDQHFELQLASSYPVSEYTVQYQETDLDFLQRILEHHGIAYYFQQDPDGERVRFVDNNAGFSVLDRYETVPYMPGEASDLPGVRELTHRSARRAPPSCCATTTGERRPWHSRARRRPTSRPAEVSSIYTASTSRIRPKAMLSPGSEHKRSRWPVIRTRAAAASPASGLGTGSSSPDIHAQTWVPLEDRDRLLDTIARHLAPNGVAYVSYETPFGSALRGQLRRLLTTLAPSGGDPLDAVRSARSVLETMAACAMDPTSSRHAAMLDEVALALERSDEELAHDLLAPFNEPLEFGELCAMAASHGLAYLSELAPALPNGRHMSVLRSRLAQLEPDPIRVEQMSDLLTCRAMRATLLCRTSTLDEAHEPTPADLLAQLEIASPLSPEPRCSLDDGACEHFEGPDGARLGVSGTLLKAVLVELAACWPQGLPWPTLLERAARTAHARRARPSAEPPASDELRGLEHDVLELHDLGLLELRRDLPTMANRVGARPRVSALTRLEAELGEWVSTPFHRALRLEPDARALARALDGSIDLSTPPGAPPPLVERLAQFARQGLLLP